MHLYILSNTFNFLGLIEEFKSFTWIRRYTSCGEFELHVPFTNNNRIILSLGNIIYKKNDTEAGIINYLNYKLDTDGKEIIIVKGKFASSYLNQRIALGTSAYSTTAESLMRSLITTNVITPTDSDRTIDNFILGTNNSFLNSIVYTLDNREVLEDIEAISTTSSIGFKTEIDITNEQFVFNVYKGLDRSVNQSTNTLAVFSKDLENVLEQEYFYSQENYKNFAYDSSSSVGSETGLNRFETFVDKDLDVALAERPLVINFDSKIKTNSSLVYKTNYDLGDIVTCINNKWNISIDVRITEIEEVYEIESEQINITFGDSLPTLIDKILKLRKG
jgi:hypothetical protein